MALRKLIVLSIERTFGVFCNRGYRLLPTWDPLQPNLQLPRRLLPKVLGYKGRGDIKEVAWDPLQPRPQLPWRLFPRVLRYKRRSDTKEVDNTKLKRTSRGFCNYGDQLLRT